MDNGNGHLGRGITEELKIENDKFKEKYESNIKEIFTILDTDKSETINLQELKILYPDAAHTLFERFDTDGNEELDVEELKELINSNQLATDILNQLRAQEYEKNIIEIFDFLVTDLSKKIRLKELTDSHPDAANYFFNHFDDLDESCDLGIDELKKYIDSYTLSKEFINVMKANHYEWALHALSPLLFGGLAYVKNNFS